MVNNKKEVKRAVHLWNLSFTQQVSIIRKDVYNYDYEDNGRYWKKTSGTFMKPISKPIVKRNFIAVDGVIVSEPLTDYMLIKEIDYLEYGYGNGNDIIFYLTGKKGNWLI